jgi:hypothetical protein
MSKLRTLDISVTSATDETLQHVAKMTQLQTLYLAATKVTDAGLELLRELEHLTEVDVSETAVTDTGLLALTGLKSLVKLNLRGLNISMRGLRQIAALPRLRSLRIDGEAFPRWALRCFHLRRPRLEIWGMPERALWYRLIGIIKYRLLEFREWVEWRLAFRSREADDDVIPF